jgi:hypothetical protein
MMGGPSSIHPLRALLVPAHPTDQWPYSCSCALVCCVSACAVCFVLEEVVMSQYDQSKGADPYGPMSGQVISTMKDACRKVGLSFPGCRKLPGAFLACLLHSWILRSLLLRVRHHTSLFARPCV